MSLYPGSLFLCVPRAGVCINSPYLEPWDGNGRRVSCKTLLFSLLAAVGDTVGGRVARRFSSPNWPRMHPANIPRCVDEIELQNKNQPA